MRIYKKVMKHYHKNPRQISDTQFNNLKEWLAELGDLSGIVHDLNSDEIIGGNQRSRIMLAEAHEIVLTEKFEKPTATGTVALGYIIWKDEKYNYRQVRWDAKRCEKANIVANKAGGTWDTDILANQFELQDLAEWGFESWELHYADLELNETNRQEKEKNYVMKTEIIFDNEEQKERWFAFLRYLKQKYPDAETIAERIDWHLQEIMK